MAIGFRREYTPSTIDFSYLDPVIPDFKSTPKVGETSQAPAMGQSGSNDRDPRIDPIFNIPVIPPMAPIEIPDSYDLRILFTILIQMSFKLILIQKYLRY